MAATAAAVTLWGDKHRPRTLDELEEPGRGFHPQVVARLRRLMSMGPAMPHVLVSGPPGSGKRTHVAAMLHAMHGLRAQDVTLDMVESGGLRVPTVHSAWHVHYSAATTAGNSADKTVALEAIGRAYALSTSCAMLFCKPSKPSNPATPETAGAAGAAGTAGAAGAAGTAGAPGTVGTTGTAVTGCMPILVIEDADRLSRGAQCALRCAMEGVSSKCRVVLISSAPSRVISALKSRCCVVALPAPSVKSTAAFVQRIAEAEGVTNGSTLTSVFAMCAARNPTAAACRLQNASAPAAADTGAVATAWTRDAVKLVQALALGRTEAAAVKTLTTKLVQTGVPSCLLLQTLVDVICSNAKWAAALARKPAMHASLLVQAAVYDHRVAVGPAAFEVHVDGFVAFLHKLAAELLLYPCH
jgi:replication factor C subunit 3/5